MRAIVLLCVVAACGTKPAAAPEPAPAEPASSPAPKKTSCAPQVCAGQGMCDAYFEPGFIWTGSTCVKFGASGCSLTGKDCDKLAKTETECTEQHTHCKD